MTLHVAPAVKVITPAAQVNEIAPDAQFIVAAPAATLTAQAPAATFIEIPAAAALKTIGPGVVAVNGGKVVQYGAQAMVLLADT